MTKKPRKSLNDTLAQQFVYGGTQPEPEPEPEAPPELPQPKTEPEPSPLPQPQKTERLSLMDKLQMETKEPTKRFTIDLAESLHRKLSLLCARSGRSKADIVRMLLEEALQDVDD
jgi:hypothetical protein